MSTEEKLAAWADGLELRAKFLSEADEDDWREEAGASVSVMNGAAAELRRLSAEVQELRAALRPFAEHDVGVVSDPVFTIPDEHPLLGNGIGNDWHPPVTVGRLPPRPRRPKAGDREMSSAGRKMIKAAKAAVKFSRLLSQFEMEDKDGCTTVFVTKKGKLLGTVHGSRIKGRVNG